MAAANVEDTVPGMDRLLHLGVIHVQQTIRLHGHKYLVNTVEGETLFTLEEDGDVLTCFKRAQTRWFMMDAVDCRGNTAFSLRRPEVLMSDKVKMSMNGQLVTVVLKEPTFRTPVFSINDANGTPTLRIKGRASYLYEFKLQNRSKFEIGSITKNYRGFIKEMCADSQDYVITFPVDLDVRYKAAVISACIHIDYRYHN